MIPYKFFQILKTNHFQIRAYQEPGRVAVSLGLDFPEHGELNFLLHLRILIWEIDLEIDYTDPNKPSKFKRALYNIIKI